MILCEYPDRCAQHKRLKMKCPYCDNSSRDGKRYNVSCICKEEEEE